MGWLDSLLAATKESESPREFYYWAGLSAIAASAGNRLYLDCHFYKLYPNIFVMLIGKSGLRKGPPVALAKSLVQETKSTRVISGRSSIQAILKDLGTAHTEEGGGAPLTDAVGYLVSSEFASFIIKDDAALTILTDLYDSHYNPEWRNITKGQGVDVLKAPCLTMIGASNEIHFREAVPDNALGGGFIARTFVILAERKAGINSLVNKPDRVVDVKAAAAWLKEVSKLKGEMKWSPLGGKLYDDWYTSFSKADFHDPTGTLDRLHDSVKKVAMLLSLSRGSDLILSEEDVQQAIDQCLAFVPGSRKVTMGQGKSQIAPAKAMVVRELLARPGNQVSKKALLRKYWAHFDTYDLERIVEDLQAQKAIDIVLKGTIHDREVWYKLKPEIAAQFNSLQKEEEEGA